MLTEEAAPAKDFTVDANARSLSIMNALGDVTLTWAPENDDEARAYIQKQMDAGIAFFIIKKLPLLPIHYRKKVNSVDKLAGREVDVGDRDLEKLIADGKLQLARREGQVDGVELTRDADLAARSHTVGVRPLRGG